WTRESIIREIQYNSKAQSAFTTGFQGAIQRSYGFWGVGARYKDDESFEQELYIRRIPNPDSVLIDPNYQEQDGSDIMGAFVLDKMRKEDFKRKYPNAEITDFTPDVINLAPGWIDDKEVQVAEWWRVNIEQKELVEGKKKRTVNIRTVTQYETNGVEIL